MDRRAEWYRKFRETKQEKLRLEIALEEFLGADDWEGEEQARAAYEVYLQKRIRPAMERLISRGDVDGIERLAGYGWITQSQLEGDIRRAMEQEQRAVLLCLLHIKNRLYGFEDRTFSL